VTLFAPERAVLREVAGEVHAFVQPDGGWCLSNAGLIGGSVLVDTAATQARAERLRDEVARVSGGLPDVLVNTHHHGDHVFGNGFFAPPATIVAHERQRQEMLESGLGLTLLWPDVEWGDLRVVPPSLTFRDAITLHANGLIVEVFHVGPAHTTNDVVVWVPDRGVLFCGDVALAGATPFCLMGSVAGSVHALTRLRALGASTVVPGHGPVSGPEIFDATERYLRWVGGVARQGVEAGLSPLETARQTSLGDFGQLLDAERLVGNLHRAYAEFDGRPLGTPIPLLEAFQDIAEFNGRWPTCHA
jgi:cyclase